MRSRTVILSRAAKFGCAGLSLLLGGFGIVLMAWPDLPVLWLRCVLGGLFLAFGAMKIVGYFSNDLYRLAFQYDLGFGFVLMVIGFAAVVRPQYAVYTLCAAMGVYILADGLLKICLALDARRFGITAWWPIAAAAVLTGALAVALLLRPGESTAALVVLFGVSLTADAVLNLLTVLLSVKVIDPGGVPQAEDRSEPLERRPRYEIGKRHCQTQNLNSYSRSPAHDPIRLWDDGDQD